MLRSYSDGLCLIVVSLFIISTVPVLGQTTNGELISGLFGIISDGSVNPELVKAGAEKTFELIGNAHQCDNAVNSYRDAYRYYNCGSYDLASMCINKSIEAWEQTDYLQGLPSAMGDIGPSDSWNLKGLILSKLDRYDEAISCFDTALDFNPENYYAWTNKGDVLYSQGIYEEAIKCYDNSIAINPSYTTAYIQKNSALSAIQSSANSQEKSGVVHTFYRHLY